jgi:hypothetical protein
MRDWAIAASPRIYISTSASCGKISPPPWRYFTKRVLLRIGLAAVFAVLPLSLVAQSPDDALHAPDGNSYQQIINIFISPLTNSPFTATVSASVVRELNDGTTIKLVNHRLVVRDSKGRIYQERRRLVPPDGNETSAITRIEISDPGQHIKYFCFQLSRTCTLANYNVAISEPVIPVGPVGDGKHYLSREDLGKNEIEGVETIGTRETVTTSGGAMGNDREVALTKEFWYSPRLAINLVVKRLDPVQGTQTFNVSNLQLAEPDARLFTLPAGFKVIDERTAASTPGK